MLIQLTIPQWLALTAEQRATLKVLFQVPRSSGTLVEDNRVVTDGHTHPDLAHITVEKLQAFTGKAKEQDFFKLFELTLKKIEADQPAEEPVNTSAPHIVAVPSQDLFIEHNGKTYKLTEVPPEPQQPLVPTASQAPANTGKVKAPRKQRSDSGVKRAAK